MAVPSIDPGLRLLLACALAPPGLDLSRALARLCGGVADWDRLLAAADLNQLRPPLAARLAGIAIVPAGVRQALERAALAHDGHGRLMAAELLRVLGALEAANVRALPFKGPALATFLGPGPQAREVSDLDVLLDAADIARAVDALVPMGYRPSLPAQAIGSAWLPRATPELALLGPQGAILLELHWRLAPAWCPACVGAGEVLESAAPRDFFGAAVLWPRAEELFLLHVTDGMKSGGVGLRWLGDLAAILRGAPIEWDRASAIAERNGGLDALRIALAMLDDLAGEAAAHDGLEALSPNLPGAAQSLAGQARRRLRLRRAMRAMRSRLLGGARIGAPGDAFRWAVMVADRPLRTAAEIGRYLAGPAIADLASLPLQGLSNRSLRWRALRRRLGAGAAPRA